MQVQQKVLATLTSYLELCVWLMTRLRRSTTGFEQVPQHCPAMRLSGTLAEDFSIEMASLACF